MEYVAPLVSGHSLLHSLVPVPNRTLRHDLLEGPAAVEGVHRAEQLLNDDDDDSLTMNNSRLDYKLETHRECYILEIR